MCIDDHKPLFRQTGEKNSVTRFSLKFVNVDDEQKFPKTSVCIILVALVHLESPKINAGPKIVRGLTLLHLGGFGDFRKKKNSSFRLPYQHPSSSADCAR